MLSGRESSPIDRQARVYNDGAAKRGLLAVFDTLGGDHARVKRYRGELARLIH